MKKIFFILLILIQSQSSEASIARELYRGVEPMAMGNAYVAIADDVHSIFYNPAGVAANEKLELHLLATDIHFAREIITLTDAIKDLKDPSGDQLNQIMGKNVYFQGVGSMSLLAPNFGVTAFYDGQGALYAANQAFPKIEYAYQRTSGVQAAFGFSTKTGAKKGKGRRNREFMDEWRFGLGAKYVTRRGGYKLLPAAQLFSLDEEQILNFMGGKDTNYGFDLGIQRVQRLSETLTLHWGLNAQNIGDIHFANGPEPIKGNIASGLAVSQRLGFSTLTVAYDVRHITRNDDFRKKSHLGVRLDMPVLDLFLGLNQQAYFTYGLALDFWLVRLSLASYAEEAGSYVFQDPERRYAIRLDIKLPM